MAKKKKGQTPPRQARLEARGRPGQIRPTVDRARRNRKRNIATAIALTVILGAFVAAIIVSQSGASELAGLQTDTPAPGTWPPETANLSKRISALDLPTFSEHGQGDRHDHVHLDVFVDGSPVQVPVDIGIGTGVFASVHTHDASGVVHIEAATHTDITLSDVFGVWGVRFTRDCLGGYCDAPLSVYVNGTKITTDPTAYVLEEHDEIAVVVGVAPEKIPKRYTFPEGL